MQEPDTKTMVPLIKCGYAQYLIKGVIHLGFDPHPIISEAGLPAQLMDLDEEFIPHDSVKKLLSLLGEKLETEQFRQLVKTALQRNSIQRLIGEFRDCKTVREALLQTGHIYLHDSTNVNVGLDESYGEFWYWIKRKSEESAEFIWSELYAITYIVELIRALSRTDWQPSKIKVQSLDIEPHKSMLPNKCQFYVNHSQIEIYLEEEVLATPLVLPSKVLDKPLLDASWHSSFTDKVFTGLYPYAKDLDLTVKRSAELLKMSTRTFQRRLGEEGTTFRALKDSLMFTCAIEMMTEGFPLTQIATQLSFADLSQFSRSFKRVSGLNPQKYQKLILMGDGHLDVQKK
ncbi:TPA: AraC family transcriptional regulator [Vibrio harveyi]|nr:AraC family transcriptional regulator [Vibrio harveyi]